MKKLLITLLCSFLPLSLMAAPKVGTILKPIVLKGDDGGLAAGGDWDSAKIFAGKVTLFFYVDPDEQSLNDHAVAEFKKENRTSDKFQSVAVVNLAATWLPNAAISVSLTKKQKEFPDTIYAKDKNRVLVEQWGMGDDNNDIMVVDGEGKVLFAKDGKLSAADIKEVIDQVSQALK